MRLKANREPGRCGIAACPDASTIIVRTGAGDDALELCDRHWQARCAETDRAATAALRALVADDPVAMSLFHALGED